MHPVRSSFKDPESGVYTDAAGEKIFRKLIHDPEVYDHLKIFPQISGPAAEGLHEVKKVAFMNYYFEWTFGQFKDSAIQYLEWVGMLSKQGWWFSDANPSNITYLGNDRFIFIDHGSLIRKNDEKWRAYLQFIKEYAYPLLYLSNHPLSVPQTLIPVMQEKGWQFNYTPPVSTRLSLRYQLIRSALTLSAKRSLKDLNAKATPGNNNLQYNLAFMLDFIKSLKQQKRKTRWDDYYDGTILDDGYLDAKTKAIRECVSSIREKVRTAVDFGASSGHLTEVLACDFPDMTFIAIESDPSASDALYARSKKYPIIPVFSNILQLTPPLGFNGSIDGLSCRLAGISNLSMALGIIHHMMHEENLSFERILEYFHSLSLPGAFLLIEYIGLGDPRYQLIRNPNYPHPESLNDFEHALMRHYRIIKKIQVHHERILYLAEKI